MSRYLVVVEIPGAQHDQYLTILRLLSRASLPLEPIFVESDPVGTVRMKECDYEKPSPEPWSTKLGLAVDAPDVLGAATAATNLLAEKLDAANLRDHYPSLYDLRLAVVKG